MALSIATQSIYAAPFSFVYSDTITNSSIAGLTNGNPATITVTLDNGGTSINNQTWTTATDLKSITFNFNNGTLLTTFTTPFGGGLTISTGNFVTNAGGTLTSVMTQWYDSSVGTDFTTNGATPFGWIVFGGNNVLLNNIGNLGLTNVANTIVPGSWQVATPPVTGAIALHSQHKPVLLIREQP